MNYHKQFEKETKMIFSRCKNSIETQLWKSAYIEWLENKLSEIEEEIRLMKGD